MIEQKNLRKVLVQEIEGNTKGIFHYYDLPDIIREKISRTRCCRCSILLEHRVDWGLIKLVYVTLSKGQIVWWCENSLVSCLTNINNVNEEE